LIERKRRRVGIGDTASHRSEDEAMYERILVPVDGSPTSSAGLEEAIQLAKLTGGRVRLVHVVDQLPFSLAAGTYGGMSAQVVELLKESGWKILEDAHRRVADAGVKVDEELFESLDESLCAHLLEQVQSWRADIVVLGTHGRRGVRRMVLGSDAESILRSSTVPVLLVRGAAPPKP
jgi:nucleotide-binding universal stress UspA family protein